MPVTTGTCTGRPRQARAVVTREAIVRAAAIVFNERGYAGASVDQIVAEADVTKGALYFHFESKGDLAVAVLAAQAEIWAALRKEVGATVAARGFTRVEALHEMARVVADYCQDDIITSASIRLGREWTVIPAKLPEPMVVWADFAAVALRNAQAAGEVRAVIDCDAVARAMVGAIYGMEEINRRTYPGSGRLRDRIDEWWNLVLPGLTGTFAD